MNISLTPHYEAFVKKLLDEGIFGNQSEVVRAGLRSLMQQQDIYTLWVNQQLEVGMADVRAGKVKPLDMDGLVAKAKKRWAGKKA